MDYYSIHNRTFLGVKSKKQAAGYHLVYKLSWKYLKEKIEQVKGMKTLFVSCRDFDSLFV